MGVLKWVLSAFMLISLSFGVDAQPKFGLGFRLGDPSGISLKKYFSANALELSVGRSHLWNRNHWYDRRFDEWYKEKNFGYKNFNYIGHKVSAPIGVQLHYLFQKNIIGAEGLAWYYGFGGQVRFQTFIFDYRYKLEGDNEWFYASGESVTDLDIGVDGVLGLEYIFKGAPLSVFADATLFMEVADNPFVFWPQGGLGMRFNF